MDNFSKLAGLLGATALLFLVVGYCYWDGYLGAFGCSWVADRLSRTTWIQTGWQLIQYSTIPAVSIASVIWIFIPNRRLRLQVRRFRPAFELIATCGAVYLCVLGLPIFSGVLRNEFWAYIYFNLFCLASVALIICLLSMVLDNSVAEKIPQLIGVSRYRINFTFWDKVIIVSAGLALFVFGSALAARLFGQFQAADNIRSGGFPIIYYTDQDKTIDQAYLLVSSDTHHYAFLKGRLSREMEWSSKSPENMMIECIQIPFDNTIRIRTKQTNLPEIISNAYWESRIADGITTSIISRTD